MHTISMGSLAKFKCTSMPLLCPCQLLGGRTFTDVGFKYLLSNTFVQTEAELRRREAGVKQLIENGLGSCMYSVFQKKCHDFNRRPFPQLLPETIVLWTGCS